MTESIAYLGNLFYFKDSATLANLSQYVYIERGVLLVENGRVKEAGSYDDLKEKIKDIKKVDYKNKIITPGFIDTHQHATQSGIVASYGKTLMSWLNDYVFQGEGVYQNIEIARTELSFFINNLIRHGTTTAVSYGPMFYPAADLFFSELSKRNMRFITGNVLMDSNSPEYLRLSTQENYDNSLKLIEKWHHRNRLSYCLTPRFALSCTESLMEMIGALKIKFPDLYIQTHLNENVHEVELVKKAYPWSKNYLDVYDRFGLVGDQTILGHCIHSTDEELETIKRTKAIVSWCPLSNTFLGSGLFPFSRTMRYTNRITLGTDWGAGTSLSLLKVMEESYKVSMLQNDKLSSLSLWFMTTMGAAKCLKLDDKIGNFTPGKEADFIVIDPQAYPLLKYRYDQANEVADLLFILIVLGDERIIKATYLLGELAYEAT